MTGKKLMPTPNAPLDELEELLKKKGFFYLLNFLQKAQIPQNHIKEVILFFINKIYFIKGNYRFYKNKKIRDLKERQYYELNFANVRQSSIINDINSIHNDISTRSPLMDYRLKDVIDLDIDFKIDTSQDRIILRDLIKTDLPKLNNRVDKQGMRINFLKNINKIMPNIKNYLLNSNSNYISNNFIKSELDRKNLDMKKILRIYTVLNLENNFRSN